MYVNTEVALEATQLCGRGFARCVAVTLFHLRFHSKWFQSQLNIHTNVGWCTAHRQLSQRPDDRQLRPTGH